MVGLTALDQLTRLIGVCAPPTLCLPARGVDGPDKRDGTWAASHARAHRHALPLQGTDSGIVQSRGPGCSHNLMGESISLHGLRTSRPPRAGCASAARLE